MYFLYLIEPFTIKTLFDSPIVLLFLRQSPSQLHGTSMH